MHVPPLLLRAARARAAALATASPAPCSSQAVIFAPIAEATWEGL